MSSVSTIRLPVAERCGMRKLRQSPGLSSNFVKPMINKSTQRRYSIAKRLRLVVRASTVFDQLNTGLEAAWTKLRNENVLTKANVKEPMQDIRRALLEADVNLPVVRKFMNTVSEKAVGTKVVRGVRPDQQLVKVANDELVSLMGGAMAGIDYAKPVPTVILMVGLQGVGKTTACEKLGDLLGGNRQ